MHDTSRMNLRILRNPREIGSRTAAFVLAAFFAIGLVAMPLSEESWSWPTPESAG